MKTKRVRFLGHVKRLEEIRNVYKILVRISEGKRSLRRHRHELKDNIKMNPGKIVLEVVDWIYLAQDRDRWWRVINTAILFP
jgi:hypothetical protein